MLFALETRHQPNLLGRNATRRFHDIWHPLYLQLFGDEHILPVTPHRCWYFEKRLDPAYRQSNHWRSFAIVTPLQSYKRKERF